MGTQSCVCVVPFVSVCVCDWNSPKSALANFGQLLILPNLWTEGEVDGRGFHGSPRARLTRGSA